MTGKSSSATGPSVKQSANTYKNGEVLRLSINAPMINTKEAFHHSQIRRLLVIWQALDESAAVLLFQDAVVEQDQESTIM